MRRRDFVGFVGGAAAWPLGAGAQQRLLPVIGVLGSATAEGHATRLADFRDGLKEAGFVDGHNVSITHSWANDAYERLPALAVELVRARVAMIVAIGNRQPAIAAKAATATIPIVFAMGADPVQYNLVASLNRPGGNITGVSVIAGGSITKRLQLLHDLLPNAKTFGMLRNPDNNPENTVKAAQAAAAAWGVTIHIVDTRTVRDFDAAFARLLELRIEGLTTFADTVFVTGLNQLIAMTAQYAIPMINDTPTFPRSGGLMSYGASAADAYRHAGRYAGRILKGEKPADLPVLLPTKFEFIINLRTAKALGLTIPPGVLAIVDEVIE